jgi:hypothetical protein
MQRFRHYRRRLIAPVPINKLINSQTRRWKIQALHRLEVIRRAWRQVAGEYVAAHVVPVRLVRKTLRLAAEDSTWASEISYLTSELLMRLQTLIPKGWVTDIRVVSSEPLPPEVPDLKPALKLPPATPDMTKKSLDLTEITLDHGVDPTLVTAIQRAVLAALRRSNARVEE